MHDLSNEPVGQYECQSLVRQRKETCHGSHKKTVSSLTRPLIRSICDQGDLLHPHSKDSGPSFQDHLKL